VRRPIVASLIALILGLSACGGGSSTGGGTGSAPDDTASEGSITGVEWQWQGSAYNDDTKATPDDPAQYTITFADDGTYEGQADCNRINGSYTLDGSSITIEPAAATKSLCPPGSLFDQFVRDLEGVAIVTVRDGALLADIKFDTGTMRFAPAP
jgi:heat shock protein HslJ